MQNIPDHAELKSRTISTIEKSLEYSLLASYMVQASRFYQFNNSKPLQKIQNLSQQWYYQEFKKVADFFTQLHPSNYSTSIAQLQGWEPFFCDVFQTNTLKPSTICQNVSKALDVVIIEYEGSHKKEYYSGNDPCPMAITIFKSGNSYYSAFHKDEVRFDENPKAEYLKKYPFIKPEERKPDEELLSAFIEAAKFAIPFINQNSCDYLKNDLNTGLQENNSRIDVVGFVNSLVSRKKCENHEKFCFPCKTIHCKDCLINNLRPNARNSQMCECKIQLSYKLLEDLVSTSVSPNINPNFTAQVVNKNVPFDGFGMRQNLNHVNIGPPPPPPSNINPAWNDSFQPLPYIQPSPISQNMPEPHWNPGNNINSDIGNCFACNISLYKSQSGKCDFLHFYCINCYKKLSQYGTCLGCSPYCSLCQRPCSIDDFNVTTNGQFHNYCLNLTLYGNR